MSGQVTVVPGVVEAFGATSAALGASTAAASAADSLVHSAAAAATFGLIGQEFLAAFTVAQANHLQAVGRIVAVHEATAAASAAGVAGFGAADAASAGAVTV